MVTDKDIDLYYAEVKFLTKKCTNCLDSARKDKIIMFLFLQTLYNNAVELNLTDDAEKYYNQMLNLLDMRTGLCSANCEVCQNGCCGLCK